MKIILLILLLPLFCLGQGDQTIIKVPVDKAGGTEQAILHLPDDYNSTSQKYPLMVFLHGSGEGTSTPSTIYNSSTAGGPSYFISQGRFPSSFVNPADKKSYKYIVVSPQSPDGWSTTAPKLDVILTYLYKTYRVDTSRLYLTGLSAGGEGIVEYAGRLLGTNILTNSSHKAAAIIPMSAVMNASFRLIYATQYLTDNVHIWGFGSPSDTHGENTLGLIYFINTLRANYGIQTSYSGGHCCWGQFYDPNFRQNGMSIYEWALQYTQGPSQSGSSSTPSQVNLPPSAPVMTPSSTAVTLPTNSVNLNGSATAGSGSTIKSYSWTKVSGGAATISSPGSAATSVSGLAAGTYVFQLTVTASNALTSTGTVQVIVNPAAVVTVPAANAGSNQALTWPTSQATLNGTKSTVTNGTISSYAWAQTSGPVSASLSTPASASTAVSKMTSAGTYAFKLTITDNSKKTSTATTQVVVNAPPASVPTANAGTNQAITLPVSQATLDGTKSTVTNGTVSSYAWAQTNGPAQVSLHSPAVSSTIATKLAVAGTYTFRLTITDNNKKTSTATTQVVVNPAAVTSVPIANAGTGQTIMLPTSQVTLDGTKSSVTNGTLSSYAWAQTNGPAQVSLHSPATSSTIATKLTVAGIYVFRLTVTDNNKKTSTATTQVVVSPAGVVSTPPPVTGGGSGCGGVRRALAITGNDQGKWITPSNFTVHPGDTLVVNSKYRWSYLSGDGLHGTNSCPIVVMNDTGQVEITSGIAFTNSTYVHVAGTGSPRNFYGFYIHSYPTVDPMSRGASLQFSDRSSHCEVDHVDEYLKTYCLWLKEEAQCADSLKWPNWRLDNFSVHDIRAKNISQDGFYFGSTSPNGERAINCNGATVSPIPMRLSNIKVYNIILDSVGRSGIQLSGVDSGVNEIYNCRVTRTGFELNPTQGSGIILGGYTSAYVHDNYVRDTYQHGILCIGAGLMRVENNDIDSSGYLAGHVNVDYSCISADTRSTTNQGTTPKGIYSTIYVRNNKVGVSTNRTGTKTAYRSIDIGYGYANLPTWNNDNIICGNVLQDGRTAAEFRINPNIGYSSNCGATSGKAIPGKIEAENFDAQSGVQLETTADVGGGSDVGWIDQNDWMDYKVNVATAGKYTVSFRVSTPYSGAGFQLKTSSGAILATVTPSGTGGFQNWASATATVVLPAGSQTLRIQSSNSVQFNINWMQFSLNTTGTLVENAAVAGQSLSLDAAGEQANALPSVNIFPNPVSNSFTLDVANSLTGDMNVRIVDITGATRHLYTFNKGVPRTQVTVAIGDLAPGVYFVKIEMQGWSIVRKIVKM